MSSTTVTSTNKSQPVTKQDDVDLLDRAKIAYREVMPEALGGGYPVQTATIKDESGHIIAGEKPILDQIKEKLADKEKVDPKAKEQAQLAKESQPYVDQANKAKLAAEEAKLAAEKAQLAADPQPKKIVRDGAGDIVHHRQPRKKSIPDSTTVKQETPGKKDETTDSDLMERAKITYRQTMPEALGGGYPVEAGVIKNDQIKTKASASAAPVVSHKGHVQGPVEVAPGHAKIAIKEAKYHLEEAKKEVQLALEAVRPHLEKAVAEATPHIQKAMAHMSTAGEEGMPYLQEVANSVKEAAEAYIEQIMSQANAAGDKGQPSGVAGLMEQVKPHLEKVAGTLADKAQDKSDTSKVDEKAQASERSALEKAKIAYRETMPEVLGGRPSSIPEVLQFAMDRQVKAQKEYEELKEFQQTPEEDRSLADKIKHGYKEAMPSVLGGRPATMGEMLQGKVDNIKKDAQEEVDNLKQSYEQGELSEHVKEKAKQVEEEYLPESMGGRPATLGEKVKSEITTAIIKNRGKALINGTLEQIENSKA